MGEMMEGWYTDPFERHEARWMSQGTPTSLVRDGTVEGSDPVANGPIKVTPVRIEGHPDEDGSDLLRADEAEREGSYDPQKAGRSAWDVLDRSLNGP
jgi:hypothetical protein